MTGLDRLIGSRRSIRRYSETPPSEEQILEMIGAASKSPSPSNRQPVRFIRVRSPEAKERLRQASRIGHERLLSAVSASGGSKKSRNWVNAYYRFSDFMFEAPALFAVGTAMQPPGPGESLRGPVASSARRRDLDISVGLALMSYLLKGEELGLGSCILTAPLIFIEEPEKIMALDGIALRCFVTTGRPYEKPPFITRMEAQEIYQEV